MNKNYKAIKEGGYSGYSAGMIGVRYVLAIPMGICDVPEYFPITEEEFNTFYDWFEETEKIYKIEERTAVE